VRTCADKPGTDNEAHWNVFADDAESRWHDETSLDTAHRNMAASWHV